MFQRLVYLNDIPPPQLVFLSEHGLNGLNGNGAHG